MAKHTPTPWIRDVDNWLSVIDTEPHTFPTDALVCQTNGKDRAEAEANRARIVAVMNAFHSPEGRELPTEKITPGLFWEAVEALRLHHVWAEREHAGPDYNGLARDTHSNGEKIWRDWWEGNLELCDRANLATAALLAKLED